MNLIKNDDDARYFNKIHLILSEDFQGIICLQNVFVLFLFIIG